jgi:tetratricopeptide (TPR) repeat protein
MSGFEGKEVDPEGDSGEFRLVVDPKKHAYIPGAMFKREQELLVTIRLCEDRLVYGPNNPVLTRKLARARFKLWHLNLDQGAVAVARACYEKAMGFPENHSLAYLWAEAAMLYTCAGAYEGAVQLYENLIMDTPLYAKLPRVHMQLGALYRRLGNYDKAFHHFLCVSVLFLRARPPLL